MSIFRSEEMTLCQLFLQSEAAYPVVAELGELGMVQFRDLNPDVNAFQRKFVSEVRRCEEMERKMRYIEKEMTIDGIKMDVTGVTPKAPPPKEMVDLEASLEKMESELREVKVNEVALKRNYLDLAELKEVLTKVQGFFAAHAQEPQTYMEDHYSVVPDNSAMTSGTSAVQLGFITGVIKREKVPAFERLMWFACRGNVFPRFDEIKNPLIDPVTGDEIRKNVFIVFYQGEQLKNRVRKICEGFHANVYPCPDTAQDRQETLTGVTNRLLDLNIVLAQTKEHRIRVLTNAKKELYVWRTKVEKIKAIYHTLNMFNFDVSHNSLIAEGWTPVIALEKVQAALEHGKEVSSSHAPNILHRMQTTENPPTYIQNNKFTSGFQAIVDAYGVADYGEVNPALYTVITFPFLFGVMFGDSGHGFLLFLFGLTLVLLENKLSGKGDNEIFNTFFGGRYIIMLMGLFAMYTGLIYNDCYSKSFNIFGTSWHSSYSNSTLRENTLLQFDPNQTFATGQPYPFGLDPIWQMTKNKLSFTNSYKMKMSVVIAVVHMLFGVFLSLINNLYFARPMNIFCEFIPQVIFLLSIFGYLDILIFYKWIAFSVQNLAQAQSLLLQLISMFLFESKSSELYNHQTNIQTILVILAFICVPWMLLIKPFILWFRHQAAVKRSQLPSASSQRGLVNCDDDVAANYVINVDEQVEVSSESLHSKSELPEFNFGDIFVHQCIHTIEYCLGCISNTASYLRLWALSLAHAELSEVLWNMVMRIGLSMNVGYIGCIIIFAVFFFWAILTIAILLVMEGLSAFLHALRLHWVEFQNKFYSGNGYTFQPFDFQHCINIPFDD
ncbi:V-type proton ATPase 116 kDa subunit a1 [Octopus sinensis]|uniref:V-type proton ATPase subunit a n=1 Tax=Octopus sinensis TaxID=2607531 RepID=A0A6P7TZ57_9MOLL|nr:V-type proton ATPase 116 kDa subunit a1 [Octopus sinensis]XP_029654070.1 V-type proton ATPase 116 kDa subunit a1 [Octopus sinensis]XP_036363333.1 V-type proton ATPase 116 kDa subunit a1 [Octopus sinensis]